jgi:hypothetical protein
MFFHLIMPAEVELHPRHFGPTMRNTLEQKLTREVHNQPPIMPGRSPHVCLTACTAASLCRMTAITYKTSM